MAMPWIKKRGQVNGLNLCGCEIKDISFLRDLSGLTHLSLMNNQLTEIHLTPLNLLTKLSWLNLSANQLTDLSPLSKLISAASEKPFSYKYKLLQILKAKNRDALCEKSSEDVSVDLLLNDLLPTEDS